MEILAPIVKFFALCIQQHTASLIHPLFIGDYNKCCHIESYQLCLLWEPLRSAASTDRLWTEDIVSIEPSNGDDLSSNSSDDTGTNFPYYIRLKNYHPLLHFIWWWQGLYCQQTPAIQHTDDMVVFSPSLGSEFISLTVLGGGCEVTAKKTSDHVPGRWNA